MNNIITNKLITFNPCLSFVRTVSTNTSFTQTHWFPFAKHSLCVYEPHTHTHSRRGCMVVGEGGGKSSVKFRLHMSFLQQQNRSVPFLAIDGGLVTTQWSQHSPTFVQQPVSNRVNQGETDCKVICVCMHGMYLYTLLLYQNFIILFHPESKAVTSMITANGGVLTKDTPLSMWLFCVRTLPLLTLCS